MLFKGKAGIGKSFLFQQLLQQWIDNELEPDGILIYFQLKYLSRNSSILYELMQALGKTCESMPALCDIFRNHKSIILLDGLNDLSEENESVNMADQIGDSQGLILTVNDQVGS